MDWNQKTRDGETLLQLALKKSKDSFEMIRLLIDAKVDPKYKDKNDSNYFHHLCKEDKEDFSEIADLLIQHCDINAVEVINKSTPLMEAIYFVRNPFSIKKLLELKADPNLKNSDGSNSVQLLMENANIQTLEFLIEHKAKLNILNQDSQNLLQILLKSESVVSVELVKMLVEQIPLNLKFQDMYGCTALTLAIINEKVSDEVIEYLIKKDSSVLGIPEHSKRAFPIHFAATRKSVSNRLLKTMIEYKSDPNAENSNEDTPLHFLSNTRFVTIENLRTFIENGFDIKKKNASGRSILHSICNNSISTPEMFEYLIEKQCDVNLRAYNDYPLHLLSRVYTCNPLSLELLLNAKADPNLLDNSGQSPVFLLYGDDQPRIECLKILVKHKADLNIKDCSKNTVLHQSIKNREKVALIGALILNKASVDILNGKDKPPLYYCCNQRYANKYTRLLVANGADPYRIVPNV